MTHLLPGVFLSSPSSSSSSSSSSLPLSSAVDSSSSSLSIRETFREANELARDLLHELRPQRRKQNRIEFLSSTSTSTPPDSASTLPVANVRRNTVVTLPNLKPLPPYRFFVPLKSNLWVEDDRVLRFNPTPDDLDPEAVIEKVLEGKKELWDDHIGRPELTLEQEAALVSVVRKHGNKEKVYELVKCSLFLSQDYSVEELRTRYFELDSKRTTTPFPSSLLSKEIAQLPPVKLALEEEFTTVQTLLCRRCYVYACRLHPHQELIPRRNKPDKTLPSPTSYPSAPPCGIDCFRSPPISMTTSSSPPSSVTTATSSPSSSSSSSSSSHNWSNVEKIIFARALSSFGSDFCLISKLLPNKTCKQTALYAATKPPPDVEVGRAFALSVPKQHKHGASSAAATVRQRLAAIDEDLRESYVPCYHKGPCTEECECVSSGNLCLKYCQCSLDCKYRFRGCHCQFVSCRGGSCPCVSFGQECDPDLCSRCCSTSSSSSSSSSASSSSSSSTSTLALSTSAPLSCSSSSSLNCFNSCIFLGKEKKTKMGVSSVQGWGLFAGEAIEKGEFILEYIGEVVSHEESERRGRIYDLIRKTTFLFEVSQDLVVDSTRKGNGAKMINHSDSHPNCQTDIIVVNGTPHIAIFAIKPIRPDEELFFHYGKDTAVILDPSARFRPLSTSTTTTITNNNNSSSWRTRGRRGRTRITATRRKRKRRKGNRLAGSVEGEDKEKEEDEDEDEEEKEDDWGMQDDEEEEYKEKEESEDDEDYYDSETLEEDDNNEARKKRRIQKSYC